MANENWEEISAWDVEEDMDMDLTQRITVHTVRHLNPDNADGSDAEDLEYQLVQAHKYPTYAAATKWGGHRKNKKSININVEDAAKENKEKREEENKEKREEKEKENTRKGVLLGAPANDKNIPNDDDDEVDHTSPSLNCTSPPPSDPDPVIIDKSPLRRHNNRVHKLSSQRLLNQLVSPSEMESSMVRGDTNRDPEFTKYKMLKKSMKYYKNGNAKSKGRKGGVDKLRVEVW